MESSDSQFNPLGHLPCTNCKKIVRHDSAKVFMAVFCCPECYEIADRAYHRLERELKFMLTLAGEAIRIQMVKGELHLTTAQQPHDIPKSELLRKIIELSEERQKKAQQAQTLQLPETPK